MLKLSTTSKLQCLAFGLPAKKTCRKQGEVCKFCYAHYGMARMSNVARVLENNLEHCQNSPRLLTRDFLNLIPEKVEYFRWFWSGDCYSLNLFRAIHEVAQERPNTKFWLATRTEWHFNFSQLPNLIVRRSSHALNDASIRGFESTTLLPDVACPEHVWECPGECGECRVCWEFPEVPVAYRFHGSAIARIKMNQYRKEAKQ